MSKHTPVLSNGSKAITLSGETATRSLVPYRQPDAASLRQAMRGPTRWAVAMIVIFLGGFGAWAALVPLAGGAVAPGVISPDGSKKTVQHLEGGIIRALHVRDGDGVKAGQALVVLESVQPRAIYEMQRDQYLTLIGMRARLLAEQMGQSSVVFPPELVRAAGAQDGARARSVVDSQTRLFESRLASHTARKQVLTMKIQQLREQIKGYQAQVASLGRQTVLIAEELEGKEALRVKGYLPKPEVLKLQRAQADLDGKRGEYLGEIARAEQQMGEAQSQILALEAERVDQIATQLDQTRVDLASVTEKLIASEDILNRTVVTAPVAGTVINLRFKTEGGVVQRGEPILEVVPADDALLIDARVSPNDIDVVHPGLTAQVHLSAFTARNVPRIAGVVRTVSADRVIDEQTKAPYYLARVEVDRDELRRLDPRLELVPGMPADVLIVTGERTMLDYLTQPFRDAFRRGFREV